MEVIVPLNLGKIDLFTLGGRPGHDIMSHSHSAQLSCEGEQICVTEPELFRTALGEEKWFSAVRIEGDTPEDGYYIETRLLGI